MARVSQITDRTPRTTQISLERGFDPGVGGSENSYRRAHIVGRIAVLCNITA